MACRNFAAVQDRAHASSRLANWAGGGDEAIAAIKASGGRIQQTADRILGGLDKRDDTADQAE